MVKAKEAYRPVRVGPLVLLDREDLHRTKERRRSSSVAKPSSAMAEDPRVAVINETLLKNINEFSPSDGQWRVRPLYSAMSKDNFASVLYLAETTDRETREDVSLMVKVLPEDPFMRVMQNSDKQFSNEINLLLKIIPLLRKYSGLDEAALGKYDVVPKCYYADNDPENPIIVMENLKKQGFALPEGIIVDYTHCKLALEDLARYHALSYALKHHHSVLFREKIVSTLLEARYNENNRTSHNIFMQYTSMDPINHILKSNDPKLIKFSTENKAFLNKLGQSFTNVYDLLLKLVTPKEPLAVLCHGDFNRNNIMYTYDGPTPTAAKLLDFQTIRYANPGTDLVFFFYLNTTSALRREHLDNLLSVYQSTLVESLVEMNVASREELESNYSVDLLKEDFEKHALLGYVISAMFVHFMLGTVEELEAMTALRDTEDMENPSEEYLRKNVQMGGDEAMTRSVAIVEEMAEMKHIII